MQPAKVVIPVILGGGAGTRLWPLSRHLAPKPFLQLPNGTTLLASTLTQLPAVASANEVVFVVNHELSASTQVAATQAQLPGGSKILAEPVSRNTAPAIAYATSYIAQQHGEDAVLLVLPADHWVAQREVFNESLTTATTTAAATEQLVVLGITPQSPATNYGYIHAKATDNDYHAVASFIEKPAAAKAAELLATGNHYWNAGIFVATAKTFREQINQHAPEYSSLLDWQHGEPTSTDEFVQQYTELPAQSFDYAVAEKSPDLVMVPVPPTAGWSDVGSWEQLSKFATEAGDGNKVVGETQLVNSTNSTVFATGDRLVALVDVAGINVVDTPDALLVSSTATTTSMRTLATQLADDPRVKQPASEQRPWGRFTIIARGPDWQVKRLEINPGAKNSLQSHEHRSENWVVVSGAVEVTIDETTQVLTTGQSCFIPRTVKHRLANSSSGPVLLIEVQTGAYLGEDDIIRYADDYDRC